MHCRLGYTQYTHNWMSSIPLTKYDDNHTTQSLIASKLMKLILELVYHDLSVHAFYNYDENIEHS